MKDSINENTILFLYIIHSNKLLKHLTKKNDHDNIFCKEKIYECNV